MENTLYLANQKGRAFVIIILIIWYLMHGYLFNSASIELYSMQFVTVINNGLDGKIWRWWLLLFYLKLSFRNTIEPSRFNIRFLSSENTNIITHTYTAMTKTSKVQVTEWVRKLLMCVISAPCCCCCWYVIRFRPNWHRGMIGERTRALLKVMWLRGR